MKLVDPTCSATMLPWLRRFNELYIAHQKQLADGVIKAETLGITVTSDKLEVVSRIPSYQKAAAAVKAVHVNLAAFFDNFYKTHGANELAVFIAQLVEYADNPQLLATVNENYKSLFEGK